MIQLTTHQETMLTALTCRIESPATPEAVARELPQYSKQQAAMIMGSLWAKGQVEISAEVFVPKAEVDEDAVRKYLSEHKDFAAKIVEEFSPAPQKRIVAPKEQEARIQKLKHLYVASLNNARKQAEEPLLVPEFNKSFMKKHGTYWNNASAQILEKEIPNFLQGNLIKAIQRENLDKFLAVYLGEMNVALSSGQPYVLDFYSSETHSVVPEYIRYVNRDVPVFCKTTGAKYYSFDRDKILKAVHKLSNVYVDNFPIGGMSLRDQIELLGLSEGFTPEELKKSFRVLAMKHHPDRGGDVDIFHKVETAYSALKKTCK